MQMGILNSGHDEPMKRSAGDRHEEPQSIVPVRLPFRPISAHVEPQNNRPERHQNHRVDGVMRQLMLHDKISEHRRERQLRGAQQRRNGDRKI